MIDTYQTIKVLVLWLRQELPALLTRLGQVVGGNVEAASPLTIDDAKALSSALSSYKEV